MEERKIVTHNCKSCGFYRRTVGDGFYGDIVIKHTCFNDRLINNMWDESSVEGLRYPYRSWTIAYRRPGDGITLKELQSGCKYYTYPAKFFNNIWS